MAWNLYRVLNYTIFIVLSVLLFCLIVLTPADAIYQCYITSRLTNIFIITGVYVVTFILAVLIYATRIYTNRSALAGIPKAWIPIEKEDVGKSVRRLVVEGLARSAMVAYQARPRDTAADGDDFADYQMLLIDRDRPPWGHVEHPGWSSPTSPDLPDLPYRTVIQELPNLIEAKAVSLAPPDPFRTATRPFGSSDGAAQSVPDTRVVEILRRPVSMGLREYLQHLSRMNAIQPPEIVADFLARYERARFSSHELYEAEFQELMHIFADLLRGMNSLDSRVMDDIYAESSRDTESMIGPSDEEGETDTMDEHDDSETSSRGRSNSLQPSNASTWEGRSIYTTPVTQNQRSPVWSRHRDQDRLATPRTPSTSSLRRVQSHASGSSGGSVIRLVDSPGPSDLPYAINFPGRSNNYNPNPNHT
ncbi:hypothetical protein BDV25DRAFT_147036 [Aspergillus avenaceus]|uniref:Defect at low temperature protein 1 n=1 Tax=Aspergillus avenaceus TaxID=36643 RepID=A0A5N6U8R7_ASPAV|nr:hypothetical protein BDV25DRAFT_147036 [Aspergillus avenaceus]